MKVYRFEQLRYYRGFGEYRGIFSGNYPSYTKDANYQTYGCTLAEYKDDDYRFACRSVDKLVQYFGSDFAKFITKKDVIIVEYEVKRRDCVFGATGIELAFEIERAINRTVIYGVEILDE